MESFLDLHYATFKIKSLQYRDLILNSIGCRKSNRLLRQPAHYRIFALQKYAAVLQRYDTASLPCVEGRSPRNLQRARSAKFPAQDFFASPITQRAVNVALCVLIRNRSRLSHFLFNPKRMKYESLRTDKRKTAQPFFNYRLHQPNPSSAQLATSAEREVPRAGFASVSYHTVRRTTSLRVSS